MPVHPAPDRSEAYNRGAYLVTALAHCGECHTPRNFLGGIKRSQAFAGNPQGPDGQKAPNITADAETGIGKWSDEQIITAIREGKDEEGKIIFPPMPAPAPNGARPAARGSSP